MKRLLVTGVAGFIGSHVAKRLASDGYDVTGIDDLSGGSRSNIPAGIEFIKGDLADKGFVEGLPQGCDAVLHLAGQSSGEISFDNPVIDLQKNTVSTLNLIEWSIHQKCERFIYASSMSVYGPKNDHPVKENEICQPLSCYGVGKLASEGYLSVYADQLPSVSMRMFNVYGPGQDLSNMRQGMVSIFLKQALESQSILVKGALDRYRDFIYIDDVVETWLKALSVEVEGTISLNIGTGVRTTVEQLLEKIAIHVPGTSWYTQGSTSGDQFGIYAGTENVAQVLDLNSFTPLDTGLEKFVKWAKKV